MRKRIAFGFIILLVVIGAAFTEIYYNKYIKNKEPGEIVSPIPRLLTRTFPQILGDNTLWKPSVEKKVDKGIEKPHLTGKAIIAYDLTTDSLLYEQNIHKRLPLASLTKIMTTTLALENMNIDETISISKNAATVGENAMGLTEGEKVRLEDLLYGLILRSGNDAAEAIAENSKFGRDNFVYFMNKKAEDMGLENTRFTNPSGLEGDGNQYSSAYDLLVMTRYALQNKHFAEIVSTYEYEIPYSQDHKYFLLYNDTNLLTTYPGVKGVKTGFTNEAGMCLVTYLEYEGHKIIAVMLNSQNRREEMKQLLDYSLKTLGVEPPPHS